VLRDHYTRPINPRDAAPLQYHHYGQLVFNLNRLMQRGSLMENYAIQKLQEQIITQVLTKDLFYKKPRVMCTSYLG
jgi:hypothetical protein